MTICNMTIEGGGRAGMIAPDETTFEWVEGRPGAPADFDAAVAEWRRLPTDDGAEFDAEVEIDAAAISPMVTWGTTPGMVAQVTDAVPDPAEWGEGPADREAAERALAYMALEAGTPMREIAARPRVHRLLHQLAHPGPARGGRDGRRKARGRFGAGDGRPRLAAGQVAGRGRGPRRGLPLGGLRMAHRRLLDVPGHEPRHPGRGRALRVDLEPELRGSPGQGRADPPRVARRWPRPRRSRATSWTSGSGR